MSNLLIAVLLLVLFWGINLIIRNKNYLFEKIINLGIMMLFLFYLTNNELFYLTSIFFNLKKQFLNEYVKIGMLSPVISILIYIIGLVISLVFAISIIGTIGLRDKFRLCMLRILPFYMLIEYLNIYKINIKEFDNFNTKIGIAVGSVMILLILLVKFIYSRPFIKKCFNRGM